MERKKGMIKIKICGLSRLMDIEIMNEVLPDYVGFVFANSRRQVDEKKAAKLREKLHPSIQTVGVFVNEDMGKIIRLCKVFF
jgi:phosphoribosylanthranilate isomerase